MTRLFHMRTWISLVESKKSMKRREPIWRLSNCSGHDQSGRKYGTPCNWVCSLIRCIVVTVIPFRCHTDFKSLKCIVLAGSKTLSEPNDGMSSVVSNRIMSNPWFKGALFVLAAGPDTFLPALLRASSPRDRVRFRRHHRISRKKLALVVSKGVSWPRNVQPSAPFFTRRNGQTLAFPPRQYKTGVTQKHVTGPTWKSGITARKEVPSELGMSRLDRCYVANIPGYGTKK